MVGNLIIKIFKDNNIRLYWEGKETNRPNPLFFIKEGFHEDIKDMYRKYFDKCIFTIICEGKDAQQVSNMADDVKKILDGFNGQVLDKTIKKLRYIGMNPNITGDDIIALDFEIYVKF